MKTQLQLINIGERFLIEEGDEVNYGILKSLNGAFAKIEIEGEMRKLDQKIKVKKLEKSV